MTPPADNSLPLYDRLGGAGAVDIAVDEFYTRILSDPLLAPMFDGVDMGRQRKMLKNFLTSAFGGPASYSGQDLRTAHRRLVETKGLGDAHFDAFIRHLRETLHALSITPDEIDEAAASANALRAEVLNR